MMKPLSIYKTLSTYGDVNVVLAGDGRGRSFMGVAVEDKPDTVFLFVEIDRVTLLELERGQVDLHTVMTERAVGPAFERSGSSVPETASIATTSQ